MTVSNDGIGLDCCECLTVDLEMIVLGVDERDIYCC
jgi:hypothetical protein